jgi:streptogramin lyase
LTGRLLANWPHQTESASTILFLSKAVRASSDVAIAIVVALQAPVDGVILTLRVCSDRGVPMSRLGWSWRTALLLALLTAGLAGLAASAASAVTIREFSGGLSGGVGSGAMTAGPDGNVWFLGDHSIDRITPSGAITEFTAGLNAGSAPFDLSLGADGNLWFSDPGTTKAIGRITPAGVITEFTAGLNAGSAPLNIVLGPDGSLWFLDLGTTPAIGRVSSSGAIKEFSTGLNPVSQPNDITAGADGNVWFTDEGNTKAIGRVTPAGTITEFSSGLIEPAMSFPNELTGGPDGNVWFTDDGSPSAIGRVTPNGTITEFDTGLNPQSAPDSLTAGPDGDVWFADQAAAHRAIGRISPSGTITEFDKGLSASLPDDITVGADGNLWVEQSMTGAVARISPAGAITEFTAGFDPMGGADGDAIVSGPDGNLWFTDRGEPNAIGRVALELPQATTAGTGVALSPTLTPIPQAPASLSLTKATFGNQQITLTTPSPNACIASAKALAVTLNSTAIPTSHAAKLHFFDAALFLDRGIKHRRKVRTRSHGKAKTVFVTLYTANALARHLPLSVSLRLAGLRSGTHTLKVKITYKQIVTRHGRKRTVSVPKTLSTPFRVC